MERRFFTNLDFFKPICEKALMDKVLELCYVCYLACVNFQCNDTLLTTKSVKSSLLKRDFCAKKNQDKLDDNSPCLNSPPFSFKEFCEIVCMVFPESQSFSIALFYLNLLKRRHEFFNVLGINFAHTTSSHTNLVMSYCTKLNWRSDKYDGNILGLPLPERQTHIWINVVPLLMKNKRFMLETFESTCQHSTISISVNSCPPTKKGAVLYPAQASIYCSRKNRVGSNESDLYAVLGFGLQLASAQRAEVLPFCGGQDDFKRTTFRVSEKCLVRRHEDYDNQQQMLFTILTPRARM